MPIDHAAQGPEERGHGEQDRSRERHIDRSKWLPLPNFEFAAEFKTPTQMLRAFVKLMFRLVATGVADAFAGTPEEVQLVILCKCWIEDDRILFRAYLPNFAINTFVVHHLERLPSVTDLESIFQGVSTDVQHSYRCPLDMLFPVVVAYRPTSNLVLLANQNHFDNAEQFLSPRLCKTTSGFLNFLGAFSLVCSQGGRTIMIRNREGLEEAGYGEWLRWLSDVTENGRWETRRILVQSGCAEAYLYDYEPTAPKST